MKAHEPDLLLVEFDKIPESEFLAILDNISDANLTYQVQEMLGIKLDLARRKWSHDGHNLDQINNNISKVIAAIEKITDDNTKLRMILAIIANKEKGIYVAKNNVSSELLINMVEIIKEIDSEIADEIIFNMLAINDANTGKFIARNNDIDLNFRMLHLCDIDDHIKSEILVSIIASWDKQLRLWFVNPNTELSDLTRITDFIPQRSIDLKTKLLMSFIANYSSSEGKWHITSDQNIEDVVKILQPVSEDHEFVKFDTLISYLDAISDENDRFLKSLAILPELRKAIEEFKDKKKIGVTSIFRRENRLDFLTAEIFLADINDFNLEANNLSQEDLLTMMKILSSLSQSELIKVLKGFFNHLVTIDEIGPSREFDVSSKADLDFILLLVKHIPFKEISSKIAFAAIANCDKASGHEIFSIKEDITYEQISNFKEYIDRDQFDPIIEILLAEIAICDSAKKQKTYHIRNSKNLDEILPVMKLLDDSNLVLDLAKNFIQDLSNDPQSDLKKLVKNKLINIDQALEIYEKIQPNTESITQFATVLNAEESSSKVRVDSVDSLVQQKLGASLAV